MKWNDFLETNHNGYNSIGILYKTQYVFVRRTQSCMVSEFYSITQQEYDDYMEWKENLTMVTLICSRPILYKGFWRTNEFCKG